MNDARRDELDGIIDRALAEYSNAEPLAGIEERVLQRIRLAGAPRRRFSLRALAFAVPAVAALLVATIAVFTGDRPGIPENPVTATVAPSAPPVPAELPPAPPRAEKPRAPRSVKAAPLPKREVFPLPAPLTAEERTLTAWAGSAPAETRQVFEDLQKRAAEPVEIQPLEIAPLQVDGDQ